MPSERECCCQHVTALVEQVIVRERELMQKVEAASTPEVQKAKEDAEREKAKQRFWDEVLRTGRFAIAVITGYLLVACDGATLANLFRPAPTDLGARVAALVAAPDAQRKDNVAALRSCVNALQAALPALAPAGAKAKAELEPPALSDVKRDHLRRHCQVLLV